MTLDEKLKGLRDNLARFSTTLDALRAEEQVLAKTVDSDEACVEDFARRSAVREAIAAAEVKQAKLRESVAAVEKDLRKRDAGLRVIELQGLYRDERQALEAEFQALAKQSHERVWPVVIRLAELAAEAQRLEKDTLGGRRRFRRPLMISPPIPKLGTSYELIEHDETQE